MSRAQLYVVGQFVLFALLGARIDRLSAGASTAPARDRAGADSRSVSSCWRLRSANSQSRNATLPNITPTPNARAALVESGVYAHVRHPIYTGGAAGRGSAWRWRMGISPPC